MIIQKGDITNRRIKVKKTADGHDNGVKSANSQSG